MTGLSRWLPPVFAFFLLLATGPGSQPASAQIGRPPIGKPGARSLIVKASVLVVKAELAEELGETIARKRFERLADLVEALDAAAEESETPSDAPLGIEQVAAIDRGTTFNQSIAMTLPDGELAITVLEEQPRGDLRVELIRADSTGKELQRSIVKAPRELSVRPTRAWHAEPLEAPDRWLLLEIRLP